MRLSSIFFIALFFSVTASAHTYQIQHVEPANWWVGMKHPEVQLMVHGQSIAELMPVVDYPGVKLLGVEKTTNNNYLFINLQIAATTKTGKVKIKFQLDGKTKVEIQFPLEKRRPGSANRASFSASDAVYLITPDRFANGNPANDSHPNLLEQVERNNPVGRHGGDIKGIQSQLDYIAAMGFTMIWPTPLVENNQSTYSYHGYSPTNLYRIDARFGSNDDYKKMVAVAGKKGVGVIQDIVLNHIGTGHWWMQDLPANDWLNYQTGFVPTNNQHTTVLDLYAAPEDKQSFTDGWFVDTMPDMNQRNPLLARYLIQNTVWWIEYANLAGIREDTYAYSDKNFLASWGKYILEEYPNLNIVGEEMNSNPHILAYWQKGVNNRDGYESSLPSLMDFPVVYLVPEVLNAEETDSTGLIKLYEMIANDFVYADPMNLMVFPDNHDMSRIYALLHGDLDLFKTSMLFTATTRGIPQFYYGTEVLISSPYVRNDGLLRADMPGGWLDDKANAFTGKGLTKDQLDAQGYLKKLLNWRKTSSAVKQGKLMHYIPVQGVYVYFRYDDQQAVMVIINKNKTDTQLDLSRFKGRLGDKKVGTNIISNAPVNLQHPLLLRAKESIAIEINL